MNGSPAMARYAHPLKKCCVADQPKPQLARFTRALMANSNPTKTIQRSESSNKVRVPTFDLYKAVHKEPGDKPSRHPCTCCEENPASMLKVCPTPLLAADARQVAA